MSTSSEVTVDFSDLAGVDRIRLTDNLNRELVEVGDSDTIRAVVQWLTDRGQGWYLPPGPARIAPVRLNFSVGGAPKGNTGLMPNALTAHRRGRFYQRPSAPDDRAQLLALLGFSTD
jgi:hypothetical protein